MSKNLIQSLDYSKPSSAFGNGKFQYDNEGAMDVCASRTYIGPKNQQNETKVSLPRIGNLPNRNRLRIAIFNRNGIAAVQVSIGETFSHSGRHRRTNCQVA